MKYEVVENGVYGWKTTVNGKTFSAFKKQDVINQAECYLKEDGSLKHIKERLRNDPKVLGSTRPSLPTHLQVIANKISSFDKGYTIQEITSDQIFGEPSD